MSKRAIILAGGKGTRLRPYTVVLPKPLMPLGEYPILEIVIRQLAACGFDHVTLTVNHQADIIKSYFNAGDKWGLYIDYSLEREPLGTMGPLKLIPDLPDNFLVMNGDILTDLNFENFYDYHVSNQNIFTISSSRRTQQSEFGVLKVDEKGMLFDFEEKPVSEYDVSMGVYILSKRVLDDIPDGRAFGFDDLMRKYTRKKEPVRVKTHNGFWLDIGRPHDYEQAIELFNQQREKFI